MLIANTLALTVDSVFKTPFAQLRPSVAWLGAVSYTLQLYFDISGYTDMAIGLGLMFGFHFPENFNYPYIAQSMTDFWKRWHITLVTWFRDYLFFPLSYRRPVWRIQLNLVIVFLLCGIWHEGSWKFLAWGAMHGSFLALERMGFARWLLRCPRAFRHLYVILVIVSTCVFIRAPSLPEALRFLATMIGIGSAGGAEYAANIYMNRLGLAALISGVLGCLPLVPMIRRWQEQLSNNVEGVRGTLLDAAFSSFNTAMLALVFLASIALSAAGTYSAFIYFKF